MVCVCDETSVGGSGVVLVNDCKKLDEEKFGRNKDDVELVPLEGTAAAEKYADKSNDGRNCCENA